MNLAGVFSHSVIMSGLVILQSTLFKHGLVFGTTPDFALIVLVFSANHLGSYKGQIGGFVSGIVQDILSLAPLGLNAFVRTVMGFVSGLFKGKLFVDPVLMPLIMIVIATVLKAVLAYILLIIFMPSQAYTIFTGKLAVELGLNALLAPFFFGLLKLAKIIKPAREDLSL